MDRESDLSVSGINERVIRYADILLLYAESIIQTNGPYEDVELVNTIRKRAGVLPLQEGDYDSNY